MFLKAFKVNKTQLACATFVLGIFLSGCSSLGMNFGSRCPRVNASDVDHRGYLKITDGVTKKCQIMQVDLGEKPTIVIDQQAGTELDLYPDGVFFLYDKQETLIKHNLKSNSAP
jgi:hypothetical protein